MKFIQQSFILFSVGSVIIKGELAEYSRIQTASKIIFGGGDGSAYCPQMVIPQQAPNKRMVFSDVCDQREEGLFKLASDGKLLNKANPNQCVGVEDENGPFPGDVIITGCENGDKWEIQEKRLVHIPTGKCLKMWDNSAYKKGYVEECISSVLQEFLFESGSSVPTKAPVKVTTKTPTKTPTANPTKSNNPPTKSNNDPPVVGTFYKIQSESQIEIQNKLCPKMVKETNDQYFRMYFGDYCNSNDDEIMYGFSVDGQLVSKKSPNQCLGLDTTTEHVDDVVLVDCDNSDSWLYQNNQIVHIPTGKCLTISDNIFHRGYVSECTESFLKKFTFGTSSTTNPEPTSNPTTKPDTRKPTTRPTTSPTEKAIVPPILGAFLRIQTVLPYRNSKVYCSRMLVLNDRNGYRMMFGDVCDDEEEDLYAIAQDGKLVSKKFPNKCVGLDTDVAHKDDVIITECSSGDTWEYDIQTTFLKHKKTGKCLTISDNILDHKGYVDECYDSFAKKFEFVDPKDIPSTNPTSLPTKAPIQKNGGGTPAPDTGVYFTIQTISTVTTTDVFCARMLPEVGSPNLRMFFGVTCAEDDAGLFKITADGRLVNKATPNECVGLDTLTAFTNDAVVTDCANGDRWKYENSFIIHIPTGNCLAVSDNSARKYAGFVQECTESRLQKYVLAESSGVLATNTPTSSPTEESFASKFSSCIFVVMLSFLW